jgi:uncharacterized protein YndB with AHSA1/START domain
MTDTAKSVKKKDLVFTRVFDAPVGEVWKAWVDPEYVMRWWGPEGFTAPSAEMDFREGGTSLVRMRAPKWLGGQDMYNTWTYRRIVPNESIEYVLHFADKDGNKVDPAAIGMFPGTPKQVRNLVTFKDLGDGKTELTVTEYDWTVGQMMEMSKMGMEQCLDKMAAIFAKA